MFLNGNQDHLPIEVSALSTRQALQAVPRRLSNLKAEVAALSAGEAGFAGEAGVDAAYDEYAGEAGSAGEEGVNAGCGLRRGRLGLEALGINGGQRQILLIFWAMQVIFFDLPVFFLFFLHLVVGYAKLCWRDEEARVSNAALCQYSRIDYCTAVMCSMQCYDMRRKYGLNVNIPGTV